MDKDENASLIAQGAEARVTRIRYLGQNAVLKTRLPKRYRHPDIDNELTSKRMLSEARTVAKLRKNGIMVPAIYLVDLKNRHIVYEYIKGDSVTVSMETISEAEQKEVLEKIGILVAHMHNVNVIHGDLTPRNMIRSEQGDIYLVDFGLSYVSTSVEDKGVDLYVLERCYGEDQFEVVIEEYLKHSTNAKQIMSKLAEVRLRGRKRDLSG